MVPKIRNNEDNPATRTRLPRVKVLKNLKKRPLSQNKPLKKVKKKKVKMLMSRKITAEEVDADEERNPQKKVKKEIRNQPQTTPKNPRRKTTETTTDNKIDLLEEKDVVVETEINLEKTTEVAKEVVIENKENPENKENKESPEKEENLVNLVSLEKIMLNAELVVEIVVLVVLAVAEEEEVVSEETEEVNAVENAEVNVVAEVVIIMRVVNNKTNALVDPEAPVDLAVELTVEMKAIMTTEVTLCVHLFYVKSEICY